MQSSKVTDKKKVRKGTVRKERSGKIGEKKIILAHARYLGISPRKTRIVVDMIRGRMVEESLIQLSFLNKKAAGLVRKTISCAAANAVNNFDYDRKRLIVKKAFVGEAPVYKRWRAGSRGRGKRILKPNCHITIGVTEK